MNTSCFYSVMLAITLACGFGGSALAGAPPRNVVSNGSFEGVIGEQPAAWHLVDSLTTKTKATLSVDQGPHSNGALKLHFPAPPLHPDSSADLSGPSAGFEQRGIALNVSDPYTLSFWIRGEAIHDRSAQVRLIDSSGRIYTALNEKLYASPEWRHYEFNFQWWLNKAPDTTALQFILGEPGTLWVSDVRITCIPPVTTRYTPRLRSATGRNLVPNGSFELGADGWSSMGTKTGWGGGISGLYGDISQEAPIDGANCLKVEVGPGKSPVTYYDCWPTARVVQNTLLAANHGWIDVTPGQNYTLSAYMKASRPGVTGRLLIRQGGDPLKGDIKETPRDVALSEKWERYSLTIKAETAQMCVAVGPDITTTSGTPAIAWIDGIQLEAGSQPSALASSEPLEIGFEVAPKGHVFAPGENVILRLSAASTEPEAKTVLLKASIRDYFGKTVETASLNFDVPAVSTVQKVWQLGNFGRGFFTVTVEWAVGSDHHQREIRIAVLAPYTRDDSLFGINHAPSDARLVAILQRAGIRWARDWSLNWGQLEPEPGQLSFAASDSQLDRLKDEGFKILCLAPPLPSANWASRAPESVTPELWNRMAYLPKDPSQLLQFISQAVKHSRDRVNVWEFLNEPVWTGFCLPQADFNKPGADYKPQDYIELLKKAYPVIKAADPRGRVIGGFAAQPWHFAREFITLGGLQSTDIFNIHNYGTTLAPESFIGDMDALLKLMDEHGGRKPIWLTECSYYGVDKYPCEPWTAPSASWAANILLRDERQCADWTVRDNVIMLSHGVEKIFYHSGLGGEPNNGYSYLECAFLTEDGQPRKLYAAQAVLAELLGPDCHFSGQLTMKDTANGHPPDGVHGYAFQCAKLSVMPVWVTEAAAKRGTWRITIPVGVQARDLMDNPLTGESIQLGTSPVYLISDTLPADQLALECPITQITPGDSKN